MECSAATSLQCSTSGSRGIRTKMRRYFGTWHRFNSAHPGVMEAHMAMRRVFKSQQGFRDLMRLITCFCYHV